MSHPLKPCTYCGGTQFAYIPNMRADLEFASTVLGMAATKTLKGRFWAYNLVVCGKCGLSQIFSTNLQELMQLVPGAQVINSTG